MDIEFVKILDDMTKLAKERNEMLKDSQYAAFALSDEGIQKEAMQTASQVYKERQSKAFKEHWNKSWKKFGQIKVR